MRRGNSISAVIFVGVAIAIFMAIGHSRATSALPVATVPAGWVDLIDVDGSINPASADFIDDAIAKAHAGGASALVIRLDTPGGLLSSAKKIVKSVLNAPLPIIVYVAPQGASATSAGTFVMGAANIAAMAPGTTVGAAHPIDLNGGEA